MHYEIKTRGTCSSAISFDLDDEIVSNVRFAGGCHGNLQAVASLVDGMAVEEIERKCGWIRCGHKSTSCPHQLALAVRQAFESAQKEAA